MDWVRRLRKWIGALGRTRPAIPDETSAIRFTEILADRLNSFVPALALHYRTMVVAGLDARVSTLHFEYSRDAYCPDFVLFAYDKAKSQIHDDPDVDAFNAKARTLFPFLSHEEVDAFIVWEDDPKWGKQEAMLQPLDSLDHSGVLICFTKDIIAQSKVHFDGPVLFSIHDSAPPIQV